MNVETIKNGTRRVVVQDSKFGFYTIESGVLTTTIFTNHPIRVAIIGFGWPILPKEPRFHCLN